MTLRYIFALSALAVLALVSDSLLQQKIKAELNRNRAHQLSNLRRFTFEQIALDALKFAQARTPQERQQARIGLQRAIVEAEQAQLRLEKLDSLAIRSSGSSLQQQEEMAGRRRELSRRLHELIGKSTALSRLPDAAQGMDNPKLQRLLTALSVGLLGELSGREQLSENAAENGITELLDLERTTVVMTIAVLAIMALFIFRPLVQSINDYFLERERIAQERENLIEELQTALASIKTLHGLIPICANCKKIRDDRGYWNQLESYIKEHSNADFTHGLCPDCQIKFENDF